MTIDDDVLAGDLLFGAECIASYLGMERRQVYHAAARDHLPIFRIGSTLCARKSTLSHWILAREQKSAALMRGLGPR
jgi:hypothetical protein